MLLICSFVNKLLATNKATFVLIKYQQFVDFEPEIFKASQISNAPEFLSMFIKALFFKSGVFCQFENNLSSLRQLLKRPTQGYMNFCRAALKIAPNEN